LLHLLLPHSVLLLTRLPLLRHLLLTRRILLLSGLTLSLPLLLKLSILACLLLSTRGPGLLSGLLSRSLLLGRGLLISRSARHPVFSLLLSLELPHLPACSSVALCRPLGQRLNLCLTLLVDCGLIGYDRLIRSTGLTCKPLRPDRQTVSLLSRNYLTTVVDLKPLL